MIRDLVLAALGLGIALMIGAASQPRFTVTVIPAEIEAAAIRIVKEQAHVRD